MKYKLKSEAVKFFHEKYATCVYEYETWEGIGVDKNALEEVKPAFISYGIKTSEIGSSLAGWNSEGSHYHFTINFPSMKMMEHDKFSKGKSIRKLMDKIQRDVDYFYLDFEIENLE